MSERGKRMSAKVFESIERIVYYLYEHEKKDWIEKGSPENHVFRDLLVVQTWIHKKKKQ